LAQQHQEHAAMMLEWIKRKGKAFDKELKDYLFTGKPIAQYQNQNLVHC
jgi:hypothetical protein